MTLFLVCFQWAFWVCFFVMSWRKSLLAWLISALVFRKFGSVLLYFCGLVDFERSNACFVGLVMSWSSCWEVQVCSFVFLWNGGQFGCSSAYFSGLVISWTAPEEVPFVLGVTAFVLLSCLPVFLVWRKCCGHCMWRTCSHMPSHMPLLRNSW